MSANWEYEYEDSQISRAHVAFTNVIKNCPVVDFRRISQVPTTKGLYFLMHVEAGLVYVGQSENLRRRILRGHKFYTLFTHRDYELRWKLPHEMFNNNTAQEEAFYVSLFTPSLNSMISGVRLCENILFESFLPKEVLPCLGLTQKSAKILIREHRQKQWDAESEEEE